MNDDDATVEIGYSPDKIVKDARGGVAVDYSYRILQAAQYTRLKAKIRNGVVETEQAEIHMPRIAWFYDQTGDAFFRKGKMRLSADADGTSAAWWGAIATGAISTPRTPLPSPAPSRAFASMKTPSRFTTPCGAMPMACSMPDRHV